MAKRRDVRFIGLIAGGTALLVDQASKELATSYSSLLVNGVPIFPGFNIVFLRNDGISFGLFGGAQPWVLVAVAVAICAWLFAVIQRTQLASQAAGCGLILGGALGNVFDRLRHGAVTDFLDLYAATWHWPAFNLADTSVVCGAGMLLYAEFDRRDKRTI